MYVIHIFKSYGLFLLWVIAAALTACQAQVGDSHMEVPYHRNPETPAQHALEAVSIAWIDSLVTIQKWDENGHGTRMYYRGDSLFSGWAQQIIPDNLHRYRYILCEAGRAVWQVGYYANGSLDHDFHLKDGKSMGSERMWRVDQGLYIDYFYSSPGEMHGPQRRWHDNGVLARDALFEHGVRVYEQLYDSQGNLIEVLGTPPHSPE